MRQNDRYERREQKCGLSLIIALAAASLLLVAGIRAQVAYAAPSSDGLPPLPRECGGVNPPGYPVPICCMFGYVPYASGALSEPLIASGAVVTLTTPGGVVTSTITAAGWLNPDGQPYFRFDLDAAGVTPGDVVTLTASYQQRSTQLTYQVVAGGQQVDLVLAQEPVTVIIDDQDTAATVEDPGFHITGPADELTEAKCGAESEFWNGTIYSATTTAVGVGPATVSATFRPDLPVAGAYELFAYAPHGCATGFPRYEVEIEGQEVITTMVDQVVAGESQGRWISLGVFDFPAGSDSSVQVTNHTLQPEQAVVAFDALKWELRGPISVFETVTVDDMDTADFPWEAGFYKNDVEWGERTTTCDGGVLEPTYWEGHIYVTYSIVQGPKVNWAEWRADLSTAGLYDLYVFVPVCFATARTANYHVYIGDELIDQVTVDQAPQGSVWVHLGTYELPAGTSSRVYLDDVTGVDGEFIAYDAVRWVRRPHFRPLATIHSLRPGSAIVGEDDVLLRGSGQDTDEDGAGVVAYEWISSLDGLLGVDDTLTIPAADLSAGTHVITFRVQDNEGLWSEPVTTHLEVQSATPSDSWHFMLYFAGDNNLSYYFTNTLARLETLSLPENVIVTVLFDQPGGSGLHQYAIQSGGIITHEVLPEGNTGAPETLSGYVLWAQETYPAERYYLAIADHGRGIQGIAWDDESGGDYLTLPELRVALHQGTDSGTLKIDVLHLDACLMGMVEVGYEIWPYADYLIASENISWALFGYDQYIQQLGAATTPRSLAEGIAETYHALVGGYPHTISVLDLQEVPTLTSQTNALAEALLAALPGETEALSTTLAQVQRFDSQDYGQINSTDEFVDLPHLAQLLTATSADADVLSAAGAVLTSTAIVTEFNVSGLYGTWWDLDNANGVSVYFPPSALGWDYTNYISPTLRWGDDTQWDELLAAYLGPAGTPPPEEPGLPPLEDIHRIFLPLILRG